MASLADLQTRLEEFNQKFPRPGIPPLAISNPYHLRTNWESQWPGAEHCGVYVFLDENDRLLYIGKASCSATIGKRLGAYFGYAPGGGPETYNDFYGAVCTVVTIELPPDHEFEAPAVEEFLIWKLDPPLNKNGRRSSADNVGARSVSDAARPT